MVVCIYIREEREVWMTHISSYIHTQIEAMMMMDDGWWMNDTPPFTRVVKPISYATQRRALIPPLSVSPLSLLLKCPAAAAAVKGVKEEAWVDEEEWWWSIATHHQDLSLTFWEESFFFFFPWLSCYYITYTHKRKKAFAFVLLSSPSLRFRIRRRHGRWWWWEPLVSSCSLSSLVCCSPLSYNLCIRVFSFSLLVYAKRKWLGSVARLS